jgi:hypothetical protein
VSCYGTKEGPVAYYPKGRIKLHSRLTTRKAPEAVSTSDEYRQKALSADLMALRATDAAMRTAYENLAHSWRELARQAEWAPQAGEDDAPASETRDMMTA